MSVPLRPGMKLQKNTISKSGKSPSRTLLLPLAERQRANLVSSSKELIPASVSSASASTSSYTIALRSRQLISEPFKLPNMPPIRTRSRTNPVQQEIEYCGWSKLPTVSKCYAIKANPGIDSRNIKIAIEENGRLTRSMTKKSNEKLAMLLNTTPTQSVITDQNTKPPMVTNVEQDPSGIGIVPSVWDSGNVCEHSKLICNPETSQDAANDSWRAIESICLDLRGIDVKGDVGVLKGPVSFEDVFEVLGLDEQGEPKVDTVPEVIPPSEKKISVDSSVSKIQTLKRHVRESSVLEIGEPEPKRPRLGKKRSATLTIIDVET